MKGITSPPTQRFLKMFLSFPTSSHRGFHLSTCSLAGCVFFSANTFSVHVFPAVGASTRSHVHISWSRLCLFMCKNLSVCSCDCARSPQPSRLCDGGGGDRQHSPAGLEPRQRQRQPHYQLPHPDQDSLHCGLAEG